MGEGHFARYLQQHQSVENDEEKPSLTAHIPSRQESPVWSPPGSHWATAHLQEGFCNPAVRMAICNHRHLGTDTPDFSVHIPGKPGDVRDSSGVD